MKKYLSVLVILFLLSCENKEDPKIFTIENDKKTPDEIEFMAVGKTISASDSKLFIADFQKSAQPDETKRVFFGTDVIKEMLSINGAVGIGYFFGKNQDGKQILIMKAIDKYGNELVNSKNLKQTDDGSGGVIGSTSTCPPREPCRF